MLRQQGELWTTISHCLPTRILLFLVRLQIGDISAHRWHCSSAFASGSRCSFQSDYDRPGRTSLKAKGLLPFEVPPSGEWRPSRPTGCVTVVQSARERERGAPTKVTASVQAPLRSRPLLPAHPLYRFSERSRITIVLLLHVIRSPRSA